MKNKLITIFLSITMLMSTMVLFDTPVYAADKSGYCGDLEWELNGTTLTFIGDGEMKNYWNSYDNHGLASVVTRVEFTGNCTYIGAEAFKDFTKLESIDFPDTVEEIWWDAFENCRSLKRLDFPASLKSTSGHEFWGCSSLDYITVAPGNTVYDSREDCNALIETATNTLEIGSNNTVIPSSVTSIASHAFDEREGLQSIVIPSGVTDIWDGAFWGCVNLSSVTFNEGLTHIGHTVGESFRYCYSLETVCLPDSIVAIGPSVFADCRSLKTVYLGKNLKSIGQSAFMNCTALETANFPDGLEEIQPNAFLNCSSLSSIDLPYTLTTLDNGAFGNCTALTAVFIPGGNMQYLRSAFSGCTGLVDATVGRGVYRITGLFRDCTSLTTVHLPESLRYIYPHTFSNCSSLSDIYYEGDVTQWQNIDIDSSGNEDISHVRLHYDSPIQQDYEKEAKTLALKSAIYRYGGSSDEFAKEVDVLTTAHSIEPSHALFDLTCTSKSNKVKNYILFSGKKKIAETTSGLFQNLNPKKFNQMETIYVLVQGENASLKVPLCLEIKDKSIALPDSMSFLGKAFSLTLDEDIPLIGGTTIDLDTFTFPVEVVVEDGKVKVGINIDKGNLYSGNSYEGSTTEPYKKKSLRKQFEEWKKDAKKSKTILKDMKKYMKKGNLAKDVPFMEGKADVTIVGYLEGEWSDRLENLSGTIMVIIGGSATFQGQTVVFSVPVTGNLKVAASASVGDKIKYNFTKDPVWEGDMSSRLTLTLEPYGGLGVGQWASAGLYGSLTNNLDIKWLTLDPIEETGLQRYFLTGELGAKAYFAKMEYKAAVLSMKNLKKTGLGPYINEDNELLVWAKNGGSLMNRTSGRKAAMNAQQDFYVNPDEYFEMSDIKAASQLRGISRDGTVVAGSYIGADPVIAEVDGITVITYVDIDESRPEANQTVLKYIIYDPQTGNFSSAQIVDNDGTADTMPRYFKNGDELYLYWQDSRYAYAAGDTPELSEYASTFGITTAAFDIDSRTFSVLGQVDGGNNYCYSPAMSESDDGLQCVWVENDEGNLFGVEGRNTIYRSVYSFDEWTEPEVVDLCLGCVTALTCGTLDDEDAIAYILDTDYDLNTEKKTVHVSSSYDYYSITEEGAVSNPVFTELNGHNVFMYNHNGAVMSTDSFTRPKSICSEGTMDISSRFAVEDDKIYYLKTTDGKRNVQMLKASEENAEGVPVTVEDTFVDSFDISGGKIVYLLTDLGSEDEEMTTSSAIKFTGDLNRNDLILDVALFDNEEVAENKNLNVLLEMTNNGTEAIDEVEVALRNKDSSEVIATTSLYVYIAPGEAIAETVSLALPETLDAAEYIVSVSVPGAEEQAASDNEYVLDFGKADIETESRYVVEDGEWFIETVVSNTGRIPANTSTRIAVGDVTLQEYNDQIAAGESVTYRYPVDESDIDLSGEGSVVSISCETDEEEYYESNNTSELRVWSVDQAEPTAISNEKVNQVEKLMKALPSADKVSSDDADEIAAARALYEALSDDEKALVSQEAIYRLIAAEKALKNVPGSEAKPTVSKASKTAPGTVHKYKGSKYKVLTDAKNSAAGTVVLTKAKNTKYVTVPSTVKLNGKKFKVTEIGAKAFTGKKIKKVTIGAKTKKIRKNAFKGSRATTVVLKTKLLKKATVRNSLKGSKVKTVQVKVGKKAVNKKYIKNYKKIFTKKITGKKVTVK